jgi:hypothetical protein
MPNSRVHWSGGDIKVYNNRAICNGANNNQAGGLFDIQGDNNLKALVGPGAFNNYGILKSAGSGTTIYNRVVKNGLIEVLGWNPGCCSVLFANQRIAEL